MDQAGIDSFVRDEQTHFWFIGRRRIFLDVLEHEVGSLGAEAVILDLGCGVGGMLAGLETLGRTFGTEIDHRMVAHCRGRGFTRVFQSRGHQLPLRDACVDLIAAFDVLEHIPEELETLAECHRILKPGGRLFVSGPSYQWLYTHQDRMVDHQRRYTLSELRGKLNAAGFQVTRDSYVQFFLFPLILILTLARKLYQHVRPPVGAVALNSEIGMPPGINRVCSWIFSSERFLLRRLDFPFGHSVFALGCKSQSAGSRPVTSPTGLNR